MSGSTGGLGSVGYNSSAPERFLSFVLNALIALYVSASKFLSGGKKD